MKTGLDQLLDLLTGRSGPERAQNTDIDAVFDVIRKRAEAAIPPSGKDIEPVILSLLTEERMLSEEKEPEVCPKPPTIPMEYRELRGAIEALLFSVSEPISIRSLAEILEVTVDRVRKAVEDLRLEHIDTGRGFRVEDIAGGIQISTLSKFDPWIQRLWQKAREGRLSPAALETLAVIAYQQPIQEADLNAIRGVGCGPTLKTLLDRGLVHVVSHGEDLGKPLLYGTTRRFLESFGITSVRDLPQPEVTNRPTETDPEPGRGSSVEVETAKRGTVHSGEEAHFRKEEADDSWNEKLAGTPEQERPQLPPASFIGLVEDLALRAMLALGQFRGPGTNDVCLDLDAANYVIDLLGILKEKTKGNLEGHDSAALKDVLQNLRRSFAEVSRKPYTPEKLHANLAAESGRDPNAGETLGRLPDNKRKMAQILAEERPLSCLEPCLVRGLWASVRHDVRLKLGEELYDRWIAPLQVISAKGDEISLGVPNLFVKDWIRKRYLPVLNRVLQEKHGCEFSVQLVIDPDAFREHAHGENAVGERARAAGGESKSLTTAISRPLHLSATPTELSSGVANLSVDVSGQANTKWIGRLMAEKEGIAISGTHGKTTTTAMVSLILSRFGLDPSFVIGGEYPELGGNFRWGKGPHFVAEACEYARSFLNLLPRMSIVTNIEEVHLDYFESLKEIQDNFKDFVSLLPEGGYLVLNKDDPNSSYLSEFCRSTVGTFSLRPGAADWWAEDIAPDGEGMIFRIVSSCGDEARVRLRVPGIHNVQNSLAATAICRRIGVPLETVAIILETFVGVRRRFEILSRGGILVIDDNAHHPTAILAVLRSAQESLQGRRLVAVFQPDQHSHLKVFRQQFADALARFDAAIVCDVYRARDKNEDARTVGSDSLVRAINECKPQAMAVHAPAFEDVLQALQKRVRDGDAVIFMGAGDITDVAKKYGSGFAASVVVPQPRGLRSSDSANRQPADTPAKQRFRN